MFEAMSKCAYVKINCREHFCLEIGDTFVTDYGLNRILKSINGQISDGLAWARDTFEMYEPGHSKYSDSRNDVNDYCNRYDLELVEKKKIRLLLTIIFVKRRMMPPNGGTAAEHNRNLAILHLACKIFHPPSNHAV